MSSAAIMEIIKQKEIELKKLKNSKTQVTKVSDAVDCMFHKFKNASNLIGDAGTIGGARIDNGATSVVAGDFKKISGNTQDVLIQISTKIATLDAEIASLYTEYNATLAKEVAERDAAIAKERQYYYSNVTKIIS